MYFSKSQSYSTNLQFGSPKTNSNPINFQAHKVTSQTFIPSPTKNLNLSGEQSKNTFQFYKPRVTSPILKSSGLRLQSRKHSRHTTQITDSLSASKCVTENTNSSLVEFQFQISSLKTQNKNLRQEYQKKISNISSQKNRQLSSLIEKLDNTNEQLKTEAKRIEELTLQNKHLGDSNKNMMNQLSNVQTKIEQTRSKFQQTNKYKDQLKEELKCSKVDQSQLQNIINKLQTQMSQLNIKLKSSQQRLHEIRLKENNYKSLIVTMSQQKTLLNNRISQLIEQQAKLHNAQVVLKNDSSITNLQKSNNDLIQEVSLLKNKINQILNEQESSDFKKLYQNKISLMQKEIQQLKHRYQSPDSNPVSHFNNQLQWKCIVDEKSKEILDLKNIISNQKNKIAHLNKELLNSESSKAPSTHLSFEVESELKALKIQNKNLNSTLDSAQQKLKYLISEGKKKDDFLKEYLCATISKDEEIRFIEVFFKKYEYQIPAQGFGKVSMKQLSRIKQLQERVNYLSEKVYGK